MYKNAKGMVKYLNSIRGEGIKTKQVHINQTKKIKNFSFEPFNYNFTY
jgi:hypothetical protein